MADGFTFKYICSGTLLVGGLQGIGIIAQGQNHEFREGSDEI